MSEQRKQVFGVISSLSDPSATIVEDYVLRLEERIEKLELQAACNYEHTPHGFCAKCGWFGTPQAVNRSNSDE